MADSIALFSSKFNNYFTDGQMQNLSVNQQLSEIQDALTQISAQVQQLKENVLTDNGNPRDKTSNTEAQISTFSVETLAVQLSHADINKSVVKPKPKQ